MTQKAETLDFPVTASGATKAADDITRTGDSMNKAAGSWDKMSQKSAKATAVLGAFGNALGPLGSQFGVLGQSVSRATGVISSMTTLIGGPWSVAIGAAAIGVGVLAKKFSEAKEKADELRKSLVEQWESELEIERKRQSTERAAADESKRAAEQGAADFMANEIRSGRVRLKKDPRDVEDKKAGGGGRGGFKPSETQFGEASDIEETADPFAQTRELDERLSMANEITAEYDKQDKADALEREREHQAVMEELKAEALEREMARIAEVEMREQQKNRLIQGAMEDTGKLGIRAANEAVKGSKMSGKAILQTVGDALVARGTQAIIEGGIFSATPFMWGSGTPMIAMGAVAIGTGMAMGAASRALPSGGGGGKSTGTPQLAPASPVNTSGGSSNSQPSTIIINMSSTLSPNADDYDRMMAAANTARKQGRN